MNSVDNQMAARVWQRVQAKQESADLSPEVLLLLTEEAKAAALYHRLSKNASKEKAAILESLLRSSRQSLSILRGIHYLLTDSLPATVTAQDNASSVSLRLCYGNTLRRSILYGQWSGHSEYACAFLQLETLARQRCALLLQLIGTP